MAIMELWLRSLYKELNSGYHNNISRAETYYSNMKASIRKIYTMLEIIQRLRI